MDEMLRFMEKEDLVNVRQNTSHTTKALLLCNRWNTFERKQASPSSRSRSREGGGLKNRGSGSCATPR
jgi:hypothetical protein